jgi:hypothetical protein
MKISCMCTFKGQIRAQMIDIYWEMRCWAFLFDFKGRPSLILLKTFHRKRGMRHANTALYFYGASKKSLHKPRVIYENKVFHISYGFNYYLQFLCLHFLTKTHLSF